MARNPSCILHVQADQATRDSLRAIARDQQGSVSQVIRQAIKRLLDEEAGPQLRRPSSKSAAARPAA
jgi:hypothetical protein